jgi:hypothetical protein
MLELYYEIEKINCLFMKAHLIVGLVFVLGNNLSDMNGIVNCQSKF